MPVHSSEPIKPTPKDVLLARQSHGALLSLLQGKPEFLVLKDPTSDGEVQVPLSVARMLVETFHQIAQGNAVTLIPIHAELTTQQAADMLNVSRPYIVKLLDEGKIPHSKVGRHRRIKFENLMAFKHKDDLEREAAFEELVALSQELNLGYD